MSSGESNNSAYKLQEGEEVTSEKWLTMFNTLNDTLTSLQAEIQLIKNSKGISSSFTEEWKESIEKDICDLDEKQDKHELKVRLLMNIVIHQEERIKFLESKITAAYEHEIKPNLVVSGIVEDKDETKQNLFELVKSLFSGVMEIEQEIEVNDVYRMGEGRVRPIMIKLRFPLDKAIIYANASKLKGKANSMKKPYYVQDDQSDQQGEVRRFYKDLMAENKEKEQNAKLNIKMNKGRIMVNNEVVRQKVKVPLQAELLRLTDTELEKVQATKTIPGPEHVEKGSDYYSYICKVTSVNEVQRAYQKMKIKHADATHVSCAYRLEDPVGPYRQQAIDDNDFGVGRSILKIMKEKELTQRCVFVVCYYGDVHLGKRRFEIMETLTEGAVKAWNAKMVKKRNKTDRRNSQSSIASAKSTLYDSQEELTDGDQQQED